MDETYVRIAGRWVYLFRAVDSHGDTVDFYLSETRDRGAAKTFLQKALSNPDDRTPRLLCMDRCRIYPAAIRDLRIVWSFVDTLAENALRRATIELDRTTDISNGDSVPCRAHGR